MTSVAQGSKSGEQPEPRPPYAQEDLKGDGWSEARAKAKKVMARSK
jgi:hypothetical protein